MYTHFVGFVMSGSNKVFPANSIAGSFLASDSSRIVYWSYQKSAASGHLQTIPPCHGGIKICLTFEKNQCQVKYCIKYIRKFQNV